jgi:hypothetical protein
MALTVHQATVTTGTDTDIFHFLAADGSYTGLGDETGVTETPAAGADKFPTYKVSELLRKGVLIRVAISYREGTRNRTGKLVVTKAKLAAALGTLDGKAFRGGVIKSARVPRKQSFY